MKKVVLSAVLEFDDLEELVGECIECILENGLEPSEDEGVPENWEDSNTWNEDVIHEFLMYQGSVFYTNKRYDFEDIFNDNVYETRVTLE